VGWALTKQLSAKHRVTVIDRSAQLIESAVNTFDVIGVCGNGASYEVQKEAEVGKAELLIATASSDEINILACLVAKKLGVNHTIARVRNPEYEEQLRFMREEMGLSMAINPERAAAHEIARVLRFPAAMKVETFSKDRLELLEYRLPENSALDGMQLLDLYRSIHIRVLICAVARKNETIIPTVRIEGKPLPESQLRGVYVYMSVYLLLMAVSMLLLSAQGFDMTTTITSVITCLNNIGPGLEVVGPMGNFSGYSPWAKLLLSFDMLVGRLEIFPMLLLFAPSIWKGRKQSK